MTRPEQIRNVYVAVSFVAHDMGHATNPYADMNFKRVNASEVVALRCSKCGEEWWIDTAAMLPAQITKQFVKLIDERGKCRGKPLYTQINDSPWFEYNI